MTAATTGRRDPRTLPRYSASEAACYLRVPVSTLRAWVFGQRNFAPVIAPDDPHRRRLSFTNLVEAYVLGGLRRVHRIPMPRVREAVGNVSSRLGVERPLANAQFATDGVNVFVEFVGLFVPVSGDLRQKWLGFLDKILRRIDWDETSTAKKLFPYLRPIGLDLQDEPRRIVIDPRIQAGRPVIVGTRIPTLVLAERFFADEPIDAIAEDFGLSREQVEAAIRWERPFPVARDAA